MAKVAAGDLPRFLGGGWKNYPVALIFGSDEGAVRETVDRLIASAAGPNPDPLNLITLDGDALAQDPPRLADEMRAFGLFGGFRVIHVRGAGKAPLPAIEVAASDPAEGALLVLEAGDLKNTTGLRGFCEKHRSIAAIACYADSTRAISSLIDEVLGQNHLTIAREARTLLTTALGADRGLSRSELEKLAIYAHGSESIGIDMVVDIVSDAGRHDSGHLVDLAFAGDLNAIEPEANRIFSAGTNPSVVLTIALGQVFLFRRALRSSLNDIARPARIHFSSLPLLERALSCWTETRLQRAMQLLADAALQARRTARLGDQITIRALWATARLARPASDA